MIHKKLVSVDIVPECTGVFTKKADLEKHMQAGAKHVILSAPVKGDDVVTVVHGVNTVDGNTQIIACASCTTNCITPVVEIIGRRIGIKKVIMTTVHASTASQAIVDSPSQIIDIIRLDKRDVQDNNSQGYVPYSDVPIISSYKWLIFLKVHGLAFHVVPRSELLRHRRLYKSEFS